MKKVSLKIVVWKEENSHVAWCLNTGVSSFGENKKEAISSLEEALELYFEDEKNIQVTKVERPDIVPLVMKYA